MKKALLVILSMTLIACNTMVSLGDTFTGNGTSWTSPATPSDGVTNSVNGKTGTSKKNVKVTTGGNVEVYSVDITWEAMSFTYTATTWLPNEHKYSGATWTSTSNNVTVDNHSNKPVTATFSFGNLENNEDDNIVATSDNITGKFYFEDENEATNATMRSASLQDSSYTLESAEGKTVNNVDGGYATVKETLNLQGEPKQSYNQALLGTVTVRIGAMGQ